MWPEVVCIHIHAYTTVCAGACFGLLLFPLNSEVLWPFSSCFFCSSHGIGVTLSPVQSTMNLSLSILWSVIPELSCDKNSKSRDLLSLCMKHSKVHSAQEWLEEEGQANITVCGTRALAADKSSCWRVAAKSSARESNLFLWYSIAKGPGGLTLWVSITHRRGTFNQTSLDLSAESPFASLLLHGAKVSQVLAPEK